MSTNTLTVLQGLVAMGNMEGFSGANGTNITSIYRPPYNVDMDLTDGAGHGLLYANPNITFSCTQSNETIRLWTFFNVVFRILYRYKKVGLTEYIGLVQST